MTDLNTFNEKMARATTPFQLPLELQRSNDDLIPHTYNRFQNPTSTRFGIIFRDHKVVLTVILREWMLSVLQFRHPRQTTKLAVTNNFWLPGRRQRRSKKLQCLYQSL